MKQPPKNKEKTHSKDHALEGHEKTDNLTAYEQQYHGVPETSTQYYTPSQFMSGTHPQPSFYQPPNALPSAVDPDYSIFMEQYGGQVSTKAIYEAKRATRQMAHYFDVSQYKHQLDTNNGTVAQGQSRAGGGGGGGDAKTTTKKITKKDLEQWKRRREERKKIRHRWLFE